jgi:hypothetical protein
MVAEHMLLTPKVLRKNSKADTIYIFFQNQMSPHFCGPKMMLAPRESRQSGAVLLQ